MNKIRVGLFLALVFPLLGGCNKAHPPVKTTTAPPGHVMTPAEKKAECDKLEKDQIHILGLPENKGKVSPKYQAALNADNQEFSKLCIY